MEINKEKFKTLITTIIKNFKSLETELCAFQMTLLALRQTRRNEAELFERALEQARKSKPLQEKMHEKYDLSLERFLEQASQSQIEELAMKFLQEWRPQGPVN